MIRIPVIICRNSKGNILLQFRDSGAPSAPLMWSFFGGRADTDDETELQAIIREAKEELGLDISESDLKLLGDGVHTEEQTRHIFVFEYVHPITWSDIVVDEGAGAAFLSKEEIATMGCITKTAQYFVATYC